MLRQKVVLTIFHFIQFYRPWVHVLVSKISCEDFWTIWQKHLAIIFIACLKGDFENFAVAWSYSNPFS